MKKLHYFRLFLLLVCSTVMYSKAFGQFIYKVEYPTRGIVQSEKDFRCFSYSDQEKNIDLHFRITSNTIGVQIHNKSDQRVYIEWQGARINEEEIAFGSDAAITFRDSKPDESVYSKSYSVSRELFAKSQFSKEAYFNPLTGERGSKYVISDHSLSCKQLMRWNHRMSIIIPIRFADNTTRDYRFDIIGYFSLDFIKVGMNANRIAVSTGEKDVPLIGLHLEKEKTGKGTYKYNYSNGSYIVVTKDIITEVVSNNH